MSNTYACRRLCARVVARTEYTFDKAWTPSSLRPVKKWMPLTIIAFMVADFVQVEERDIVQRREISTQVGNDDGHSF